MTTKGHVMNLNLIGEGSTQTDSINFGQNAANKRICQEGYKHSHERFFDPADSCPSYGRMISITDLTNALKYLDSQHAVFHCARIKTLWLEREQKRPNFYTEDG